MDRIITRNIQQELDQPNRKIILLLGQRRTGKTYELKRFLESEPGGLYFDLEDIANRGLFLPSVNFLEGTIGNRNNPGCLLLDEIQYLNQSGSVLKLLHDHFPLLKVIVTGSATFLMLKNIGDSLLGRHVSFPLFPLTLREILNIESVDFVIGGGNRRNVQPEIRGLLQNILLFGTLPEVFFESNAQRKQEYLKFYLNSLLFKDIFAIEGIRHPAFFQQLLHVLALQIGQEINPNEIAKKFNIHRQTVIDYVDLFEKFQIIKILRSFSQNPRKEITKGFKVFFTDLGIRNALINSFQPLHSRSDIGALFENFAFSLLNANIQYYNTPHRLYFWRNFKQAEVDIVVQNTQTNQLTPIEVTWSRTKPPSRSFVNQYEDQIDKKFCMNKDNLWQFI